jgi:hypothetical protein
MTATGLSNLNRGLLRRSQQLVHRQLQFAGWKGLTPNSESMISNGHNMFT